MPEYNDHIQQAKSNLSFLEAINTNNPEFWDWKVTVCFYATVHLVNGHIITTANLHYRTHSEVEQALNFANELSISKVPMDVFLSYRSLKGLSRRSRYLVNENESKKDPKTHFTHDVHYGRAIKHLSKIIEYINVQHGEKFKKYNVKCIELKDDLNYFLVNK
jgi:hypothetical protein